MQEYLFYPALLQLLPTSHHLKVFLLPGTALLQGKRLLLYNKWQVLNKQYGQTQIQTMIVNIFSSV